MSDPRKYSADSWTLVQVKDRNEMVVRVDVGKTFRFDDAGNPVRLSRLAYVLHLQPEVLLSALLGSRFADNDKTLLAMWAVRTGKPATPADLGEARRDLAQDAIEREPAKKGAPHRRAKAYPYLNWEVPHACVVVVPRSQGLHGMLFHLGAKDLNVKRGRSGPLYTLELPPTRANSLDEEVQVAVDQLERLCKNALAGNESDRAVLVRNAEDLALLGGMDSLLGEMLRSTEKGRSRATKVPAKDVGEVRKLRDALSKYRKEARLHLADAPHVVFRGHDELGHAATALLTYLRGGLPSKDGALEPLMDRVLHTPEQVSVDLWHQLHDVMRYAALLLLDGVRAADATDELFLPLLAAVADEFEPEPDELPDELSDAWPAVLAKFKLPASKGPFAAALATTRGAHKIYGQLLSSTELVTRVAKLSAPSAIGRLCEVSAAASRWPGGASSSLYFRLAASVGRLTSPERRLVYEALADTDIRKTMDGLHKARFVKLKAFGAGLASLLTLVTIGHGLATDMKGTLQQLKLFATVDSVKTGIEAVLEALGRGDSISAEVKFASRAIGVVAGVIGVIEAEKAVKDKLKLEDHTGAWFERSKQVLSGVSILLGFCAASPAAPVVGAVALLAGIVIYHLEEERKEAMGGAAHVFWELLAHFERPFPGPQGGDPGRAARVLEVELHMKLASREVKRLYWETPWWELDLTESAGRLANAGLPAESIERICVGDGVVPAGRVWKHGDEVLTVHAPHLEAKVVDSRPFKDEWKYVIYVEQTDATVGGHDEDDLAPKFEDGRKVKVDWTDGKTYTARVHRLDRERHGYVVQWKVASDEDEEKWLAVNEDDVIVLKEARKKMHPV